MMIRRHTIALIVALSFFHTGNRVTPVLAVCTALTPNNECSPGGGPKTTDCQMEWRFTPMPKRLVNGVPSPDILRGRQRNRIICYEGDPRCDTDTDLANRSCTFQVEILINNQDINLPSCDPSAGIATFEVRRPAADATIVDAADTANRLALEG